MMAYLALLPLCLFGAPCAFKDVSGVVILVSDWLSSACETESTNNLKKWCDSKPCERLET